MMPVDIREVFSATAWLLQEKMPGAKGLGGGATIVTTSLEF